MDSNNELKNNFYKNIFLVNESIDELSVNKIISKYLNFKYFDNNHPYFIDLFYNSEDIEKPIFNNSYTIKQISKIKFYRTNSNLSCIGIIKFNKAFKKKKIFIKRIPLIKPFNLFFNNIFFNDYYIKYSQYNPCSCFNIEIFISYLLSKLVELNICPNFPLFYSFKTGISNLYHFKLSKEDLNQLKDIEKDNNDFFKKIINKYNINFDEKNSQLIVKDSYVGLILMEELDGNLFSFFEKNIDTITDKEIISYIFQLVFSLSIIQKYFNLNHNDLHPGNILYRRTRIKFLYFHIDDKYYRIPTYNKIIKIIDWDRSTYNFNNYKVNNDIFKKHGEAYGQYIFKCLNNNKNDTLIEPNFSFDLSLFACMFLSIYDKKKTNLYQQLKNWTLTDKGYISSYELDFELYKKISFHCKNAIPNKQFNKLIFQQFKIDKEKINKKIKIYEL